MARKRTGPTKAVKVISASEIAANPEKYRIVGNVAKPIAVEESTSGILGGAIEDIVYVISDADIASGKYAIEGGAAQVVIDSSFLPSRKMGGTKYVIPVYVVAGSFPNGYIRKVLGFSPVAYWPMNETSGTNADNAEGTAARDGRYTGVALNNSAGPDEQPVGFWDGTNDYCDISSASLDTVWDGSAGTLSVWFRTRDVSVWTDGVVRYFAYIGVDANNYVFLRKNASGSVRAEYKAGGTVEVAATALALTTWVYYTITWDKAADEVIFYINGAQTGGISTGLGVWTAVPLNPNNVVIGALSTGPSSVWDGYLAHATIWDTALSAPQILALATV